MPRIYRKVFQLINDGASVQEVINAVPQVTTARAVENILNQVHSRITAAINAEAGETLPKRERRQD